MTEKNLRERLVEWYPKPEDARMVASDAGLPVHRIDFSGAIDLVWWRVELEAAKLGPIGLYRLRERARQDYPELLANAPPPPQVDVVEAWLDEQWRLLRRVKLLGYRAHKRVQLTLDEVFVSLRTRVIQRAPFGGQMRFDEKTHRAHGLDCDVDLAGALAFASKLNRQGLALVGDPGAGKTTLLKHLFCRVRAEGSAAVGLPDGMIPVMLRCAELRADDRRPRGLEQAIRRRLEEQRAGAVADALLIPGGPPLLVLLDGLDEVRDTATRRQVSEWLEDELAYWPTWRFVVTCRFTAWRSGAQLSGGFIEAHIGWLELDRVAHYVRRWYFAVHAGQNLGDPAEAATRAEALVATLLDPERQRRYRLRQMVQNPLMLSTLCLVHYAGNRLPEKRARLYDECIGFLLETWTRQAGRPGLDYDAARAVLQPLAWAMHHRQAEGGDGASDGAGDDPSEADRPLTITRDEVAEIIAETFAQVPDLTMTLDEFLLRIRDDCGLFSGVDESRYEFLHLSFQEYLAARHAIDEALMAELADKADEAFWREVILLALSERAGWAPFMRRLVEQGRVAQTAGLIAEAFTVAPLIDVRPFEPAIQAPDAGVDADEAAAVFTLLRERAPERVVRAAEQWVQHPHPAARAAARALTGWQSPASDRLLAGAGTGIEWVRIPAGTFWMGSSDDKRHPAYDPQAYYDEGPPRRVTLTHDYWISRHPVTNADVALWLEATGARAPEYWRDPDHNQPTQAVVGLGWSEARAFARWLGASGALPVPGGVVDLPTEAEWEYAARGADGRRYPWGDEAPDPSRADFGRSGGGPRPVGAHPAGASPFGAEDMAGGVLEWCLDAWADHFRDMPSVVDDPHRQGQPDDVRVLRGGCWLDWSGSLRAAFRGRYHPRSRYRDVGFRVVCRVGREHG